MPEIQVLSEDPKQVAAAQARAKELNDLRLKAIEDAAEKSGKRNPTKPKN